MNKTILVTGGSGFIGTVVCKQLVEEGHNVINIDRKKKDIEGVTLYPFDIDNHQVKGLIALTKPDAIIHLAADHEVGRSVSEPAVYYHNNVSNTINLLNCAVENGVKHFIYSGSSSVYGNTSTFPTTEDTPKDPQSPYARTKSIVEDIMADYAKAYDFQYISLRYFNAAGAMPDSSHGYTQDPATHLVPVVCRKAVHGEVLDINGNDYDTKDGTCERDYTHVCDIASAHIAALNYLDKVDHSDIFNIGAGESQSILDVIGAVNAIAKQPVEYQVVSRREGDVAKTYAGTSKAKELLEWEPKYTFEDIVTHAYAWEKKHKRKKS